MFFYASYGREQSTLFIVIEFVGQLRVQPAEHGSFRESLRQQAVLRLLHQLAVFVSHYSTAIHVEMRRFFFPAGTLHTVVGSEHRQPGC